MINRRSAMQSLAPTSGISGASLPKGGSFLNHDSTPVGVRVTAWVRTMPSSDPFDHVLSVSYAVFASLGTTQFPKLTGIGGNCFSPSGWSS